MIKALLDYLRDARGQLAVRQCRKSVAINQNNLLEEEVESLGPTSEGKQDVLGVNPPFLSSEGVVLGVDMLTCGWKKAPIIFFPRG